MKFIRNFVLATVPIMCALRAGLKGNAVKVGNSSRCCKLSPLAGATFVSDPKPLKPSRFGKAAKNRASQKTCLCAITCDFAAYGEWAEIYRH